MTYRAYAEGDVITITAAAAVTAGTVWAGTEVCGVHLSTAVTGASIVVAVEGIYTVPKKAGATLDFAVGEMAYGLTTAGAVVAVATGATVPIGYAVEAATTTATTVKVKLSR